MTFLYQTISLSDFIDAFRQLDRDSHFSCNGLETLYNGLIEYAQCTGVPFELDVIALCCDFVEYENLNAFREEYGNEYNTYQSIEDKTMLIKIENSEAFIIQSF